MQHDAMAHFPETWDETPDACAPARMGIYHTATADGTARQQSHTYMQARAFSRDSAAISSTTASNNNMIATHVNKSNLWI